VGEGVAKEARDWAADNGVTEREAEYRIEFLFNILIN
jgi:hypothetical protein